MDALSGLRRQLGTLASLGNLVRALRLLSAVNLRMLAKVEATQRACVEQLQIGLGLLLRQAELPELGRQGRVRLVLGSDHGLCGGFHHGLVRFCEQNPAEMPLWCVGERLAQALLERGLAIARQLPAPSSEAGLQSWAESLGLLPGLSLEVVLWRQGRVEQNQLWPPDPGELAGWRSRPWRGRCLPMVWSQPSAADLLSWLLSWLLRWRCQLACLTSLISENQARLGVMQAAEKNLDSMRDNAQNRVRQLQQNLVTEELLDIVSGFEILNGAES